MRPYSLALLSGLLLCLSFPNIFYPDFFPPGIFIAWICLLPLLISIENETPKGALKKGYVTGLFFFLLSTAWINNIKPMGPGALPAWLSLSAYLALYPAAFCFLVIRGRAAGMRFEVLWIPALWTLLELLRERLLTGFPWLSLGSSQAASGPWLPLAAVTGVYGLHFCVATLNVLAYEAWRRRREAVAALAVLLVLASLMFFVPVSEPSGPGVKVAVLQGNVDQDQAWTDDYKKMMMENYDGMMKEAVNAGAKILIWPESSFPGFFNREGTEALALRQFSKKEKVDLIFGSTLSQPGEAYFNSAVHIDAQGNTFHYSKRHLVPFGEYIPFRALLPPLDRMLRRFGMIDFQAGPAQQENFRSPNLSIAPLICYESIYGELVRPQAALADLVVVVTLDTWFGDSAAPRLHFLHSALRAVENGVWVARSAATGISGFVSPQGAFSETVPLNQKGWKIREIRPSKLTTPYEAHGPWFLWICLGLLVFCIVIRKNRANTGVN